MDTAVFEELGLSHSEIKIYLTLLELGSSSAGKMLEKSHVQNSVLHRAINTLIDKGLINYVKEGKKKLYQATDPEEFFHFIEDKKKRFEELLPLLRLKQERGTDKEKATIYKGIRGVKEVYSLLISTKRKGSNDEYLTFGGGKQCEELMGTVWWNNLHLRRIANKLPARQVFDETVRLFGKNLEKKSLSKIKYLAKEFAQFQETVIVGDKVAITVFCEHPYSFLIQDPLVSEGYRKHFELLWKNAKK